MLITKKRENMEIGDICFLRRIGDRCCNQSEKVNTILVETMHILFCA
jgi:hypothetical protein